jgi:pimeloyl-ACP methyl ester carboxylesterase
MNDKLTIIILHGWGLSGEKFSGLKTELEKNGYAVFAPDLPGFGHAAVPDHVYTLSDYAQFLDEFLKKNHVQKPVLLGHSFGGRVSLKYQMDYPDHVRALILTGTPGFTPVPRKKILISMAIAKAGKLIFSVWPLSVLRETVTRQYYYLVGARDYYRANGVMRDIFKRIVQEDLKATLPAVHVPCLLLWGADDIITPLWIARKMKESIAGAVLTVIPESDHGVSYKMPEKVIPFIRSFLNQV